MLNELDRELEKRGHRLVRYADDLVIICKSRRSAQRTLDNLLPLIEKELFLKVNMEKTKVAYMRDIKFLSYALGRRNGICQYYIHPESIRKMKAKIRELTSRNNGWSYACRKQRLTWHIRGWLNYYKVSRPAKQDKGLGRLASAAHPDVNLEVMETGTHPIPKFEETCCG
jgi:hypothetical protein